MSNKTKAQLVEEIEGLKADLKAAEDNVDALNEELLDLDSDVDTWFDAEAIKRDLKSTDKTNLGVAALAAVNAKIELLEELFG